MVDKCLPPERHPGTMAMFPEAVGTFPQLRGVVVYKGLLFRCVQESALSHLIRYAQKTNGRAIREGAVRAARAGTRRGTQRHREEPLSRGRRSVLRSSQSVHKAKADQMGKGDLAEVGGTVGQPVCSPRQRDFPENGGFSFISF